MEIKEHYDLLRYNTFGMDTKCRYFVEFETEEEIIKVLKSYDWTHSNVFVLGGGSNILFTDYFAGVVFYPKMQELAIVDEDDDKVFVRVGAGKNWDEFVAWAVDNNYGGLENMSYIPGHVGASPVQNVGAYGADASDVITKVEVLNLETGEKIIFDAEECGFDYRHSNFKTIWKNQFIVTYVVFALDKQPKYNISYGAIENELTKLGGELNLSKIRQAIINIRQAKLPDVNLVPSAGSFFKNPVVAVAKAKELQAQYPQIPIYTLDEKEVKLAAGWLIEECGWKGKVLGNAGVYEHQSLVLVNLGGATGLDVTYLANEICKSVFIKFGIQLSPEVLVL